MFAHNPLCQSCFCHLPFASDVNWMCCRGLKWQSSSPAGLPLPWPCHDHAHLLLAAGCCCCSSSSPSPSPVRHPGGSCRSLQDRGYRTLPACYTLSVSGHPSPSTPFPPQKRSNSNPQPADRPTATCSRRRSSSASAHDKTRPSNNVLPSSSSLLARCLLLAPVSLPGCQAADVPVLSPVLSPVKRKPFRRPSRVATLGGPETWQMGPWSPPPRWDRWNNAHPPNPLAGHSSAPRAVWFTRE